MGKTRRAHVALYGNVALERGYCPACDDDALVLDGKMACCGDPAEARAVRWKRMSEPEYRRKLPSPADQDEILKTQGYVCLYCDQAFGTLIWRNSKAVKLRIHWDHTVPYCFSADNSSSNFAAACHVCNGWKSDLVFQSIEEARVYLGERWQREREKEARKERARQ